MFIIIIIGRRRRRLCKTSHHQQEGGRTRFEQVFLAEAAEHARGRHRQPAHERLPERRDAARGRRPNTRSQANSCRSLANI